MVARTGHVLDLNMSGFESLGESSPERFLCYWCLGRHISEDDGEGVVVVLGVRSSNSGVVGEG